MKNLDQLRRHLKTLLVKEGLKAAILALKEQLPQVEAISLNKQFVDYA